MIFNSVVPIVKNVIENVTDLFDLNLDTVSGSIESTSIQGSGGSDAGNISVVDNDTSLYDVFDTNLDFGEIKSSGDFVLSGFTDDVIFYDSTKDRITMDNELKPLQITFPSGYIQSLKYNKVIKYDSKTVTLFNWEDGFTFPLIDYVDDGSQVTLKMYAIYSENKKPEMVLLNRVMTTADLPTDYESFLYIKDITIPAHELFQRSQNTIIDYDHPNYNIIGSMTIADGVASGFTNDNYIDTKASISMSSVSNMEIFIKMNIPYAYNNYAIIGNSTDSPQAGGFVLRTTGSTRVYFWSTSNKSNWNISEGFDTWIDLQDGTNYIKIIFNGSKYTFYHSTNNEAWSEGNSIDNSTPLADFYPRFGMTGSSNIPLPGSIDFNETYFKINNEIVWKAYNQTYKWYCKTLYQDVNYIKSLPVNIWFNKAYYTTNGNYIESRNAYLSDFDDDPAGCLIDYTDNGFGELSLHLYAIEVNNSGEYKLLISDKTTSVLENYGNVTDIEYIDDIDLQSHFNSEYINNEYELKDQFQSFSYKDETNEPSRFIVLGNDNLGLITPEESDYIIHGSVDITNKIASNFGEYNYIEIPAKLNNSMNSWEIGFSFVTTSVGSTQYIYGSSNYNSAILIGINSSQLRWWLSNSNDNYWNITNDDGSYYLSDNTKYYVKAQFTGSQYMLSCREEGSSQWQVSSTVDTSAKITENRTLYFGAPWDRYYNHLIGSGDLDDFYINANGKTIWSAYFKASEFENTELAPYTRTVVPHEVENFNIIGNPIINNKIISNFSSDNYLTFNNINLGNANSWEIGMKVITPSNTYSSYYLLGGYDHAWSDFGVREGIWSFYLSSDGSSWDLASNVNNNLTVSPSTEYLIKFVFDGSSYTLYVSDDNGESWDNAGSFNSSTHVYNSSILKMGNSRDGLWAWSTSIDLNNCYIKINGSIVWQPYKTEYNIETKGSLVNYVDDGSANTIKAYKIHYTTDDTRVILTNDTSYTDQDIDSKTYFADIVIPEHGLYTYGPKQIVENYENEKLTNGGTMGGVSPACEADSYYSDDYPYRAFDKSEDYYSRWLSSDTGGTHWITYYTPTAIRVDKIDIVNHPEGYATFQYKILVSNDNTTWTEIKSGINFNSSGSGKWSISDFTNNNTNIKYIKILSTMGYNPSRLGFNEIYIYGHYTTSGYGWNPSNQ